MTCLFWFEQTSKLQAIEDRLHPVPSLVPEAIPTVGFQKWVATILSTTQVSQNVILLALLFIYRLKKFNSGVKGKKGSEFRLMTVALMLGNKCEFRLIASPPYYHADSASPGRQHLHQQDVGRGLGHCGAGDSYYGG